MKPTMLLLCMLCATTVMAEPSIKHSSAKAVADVTTDGRQTQSSNMSCQPAQSFSPLKPTGFSAISGYGTDGSFPPDSRDSWQSGVTGAFACNEQGEGMVSQASGVTELEAMRLLPGYLNSNSPSTYFYGWRR